MPNQSHDIIIDSGFPKCAENALSELLLALEHRGIDARRIRKPSVQASDLAWIMGIAGQSPVVDRCLIQQKLKPPQAPESLVIKGTAGTPVPSVLICGADGRGLTYALLDVSRAIEVAPPQADLLDVLEDESSSPKLAVRSVAMFLFNACLEKQWFYSSEFWNKYFRMLATNRYNNFSLICGHHTTYLSPPYPYFVAVEQFPEVCVRGLTSHQRSQNLEALRIASQTAEDWGVDFTIGVWEQLPIHKHGADDLQIECLSGDIARDYCALGLRNLLLACPAIKAVQFRLNHEGGIDAENQPSHFAAQFQAIKSCGRPVAVDLRYKGLQKKTIQAALDSGLATTVSTKYWCEHLGLPYHPTVIDKAHRPDRYSYGDLLCQSARPYRVVYRLWSAGSQRILLWGDPQYARRFAQSCHLGDGEGFEVMAPLTNKGFGNQAERWRIFGDPSFEHFEYEYERYWMFYLLFGRLGYDDKAKEKIWQREIQHRFGPASAATVEEAYGTAGQIIPFLTAVRAEAASIWKYWPELSAGPHISDYIHLQPTDTAQFYAIASFQWRDTMDRGRWEPRDMGVAGFVEDSLRGRLAGKWTPPMMSLHLHHLANRTLKLLDEFQKRQLGTEGRSPEAGATALDFRISALLARYHAEKITAAMHLAFHQKTGDSWRVDEALRAARRALAAWQEIVELTRSSYHLRLEFGDKRGAGIKHWIEQLAIAEKDVEYVQSLVSNPIVVQEGKRYVGEFTEPRQLEAVHEEPGMAHRGKPLAISVRARGIASISQVVVHFRALNQQLDWKSVVLTPTGEDSYAGELPAGVTQDAAYLAYYFECRLQDNTATNWPSWVDRDPYFVVPIESSCEGHG